ncbi:uncharacterized protein CC84DRAFT_1258202 [Paraphaeosphaeria sporulosa]|uniref:Fungal N-terminal domain-containing protein n=1 Tax=Paraphaeosphaeria sporulosa TaxID=1460663 RepID=A0A177CHD4_9PLEO|nr:uncharacterized protein CC84DRAFT_1258202 [Paraphaeosphaeria sporulosa]OAG06984.1 hypothetical protein CC84DRAFT_1258202 [Paraphaeosphaeria sporulosa]
MGDPFSIAGSAVGVISLGIVACQKLYYVIDDIRTAADKAEAIRAGLDRLENGLEQLETVLGKLGPTSSVAAADVSVTACANVLSRLRDELPYDANPTKQGVHQLFRALRCRLSYPLKKGELNYLRTLIKDTHQNLHTAQLTVIMEQGQLNTSSLGACISLESQLMQRALTDQHCALQGSIQSDISKYTQSVQSGFQSLDLETSLVRRDVNEVYSMLQPLAGSLSQLSLLHASLTRLETKVDAFNPKEFVLRARQGDVSAAPGLTRTLRTFQNRNAKIRRNVPLCACRAQSSSSTCYWWQAVLSSSVTKPHTSECLYSAFDDKITEIDLRVSLCSSLLRRKYTLAMGFSHSLAKGFGIRAGLRTFAIVDHDSEAFSLIRRFASRENYELSRPDSWQNVAAELQRLFESRRASPHDRLSDGSTLLHQLCSGQYEIRKRSVRNTAEMYTAVVDNFRCLAGYLLKHTNATAREKDLRRNTCLEVCDHDLVWSPFLAQLLEHDVPISINMFKFPPGDGPTWLQQSILLEHQLELPEAFIAIVLKDDIRLSALLASEQSDHNVSVELPGLYEMTAIMSWPEGCEILMKNGLKLAPRHYKHFWWVMNASDSDMLRFWLDIRPYLDVSDLQNLGSLEYAFDCIEYDWHTYPIFDRVDAIIAAIAKQRHDLGVFAAKNLYEADYSPKHDRLLDVQAHEVCNMLENRGIFVPSALVPSRMCIYHSVPAIGGKISTYVLDALYKAGFRDLSQNDQSNGVNGFVTPLLFYLGRSVWLWQPWENILATLTWFLAKGSDLHEPWPYSASRGTHLLAWRIGWSLYQEELGRLNYIHGFWNWIILRTTSSEEDPDATEEGGIGFASTQKAWQCIQDALEDKKPDECECHCSPSGCIPMTLLCRPFAAELRQLPGNGIEKLDLTIQTVAERVSPILLTESSDRRNYTIMIRMLTFWKLEIRHTCCDLYGFTYSLKCEPNALAACRPAALHSPEDTRRIHNEDRHLIEVLENLVPELDQAYDDIGQPFQVFLKSFMLPRINKVLEQLAKKDHEDFAEGRRALGVVMQPMPGYV